MDAMGMLSTCVTKYGKCGTWFHSDNLSAHRIQRQHHSSKNEHDAHLPTKPPQSTLLLQRGDEHTFEVECA